jgi:predicted transcriptional regulator
MAKSKTTQRGHLRSRYIAIGCLQVLRVLLGRKKGLTVSELLRDTEMSRATLYRRLQVIEASGWPLERKRADEQSPAEYRIEIPNRQRPRWTEQNSNEW